MGQSQAQADEEGIRARLVESARAMVLAGNSGFSISAVCVEAGIERAAFRNYFPGRTALMAAVMQESAQAAQPAQQAAAPAAPEAPAADAWLERRLRVFERALNALEARAEASAREQARAIALLEEKLAAVSAPERAPGNPVVHPLTPGAVAAPQPAAPEAPEAQNENKQHGERHEESPAPQILPVGPQLVSVPKEEMAGVLQSGREAARAAAPPEEKPAGRRPGWTGARWWIFGALAVLLGGAALFLGETRAAHDKEPVANGVAHRRVAGDRLGRLTARADAGDMRAQAGLAMAYARGEGVKADPAAAYRWSLAAARAGQPVGEYLLGVLYRQGGGVPADPARAFRYFSAAAAKGNLKAMHNLAIAYAEGLGTARDAAKAAAWFRLAAERGYVDSAFDLAVLYERGLGVPQDLGQALTWYAVAGEAGDGPAMARQQVLSGQLKAQEVRRALQAARDFTPLPALAQANALPAF